MGLHWSLHWIFQSSDELPMIYIVLCFIYSMLEMDAPIGRPRYPWLSSIMVLLGLLNTAFYYIFQYMYWVFLLNFSVGSTITFIGFVCLGLKTTSNMPRCPQTMKLLYCASIAYVLVATPVWLLDMMMCDKGVLTISNEYFLGMTPHVVWHFCAGYGSYCAILFLAACRCEALQKPLRVDFWWGVVPLATAKEPAVCTSSK